MAGGNECRSQHVRLSRGLRFSLLRNQSRSSARTRVRRYCSPYGSSQLRGNNMQLQKSEAQKGEIEYRKKLALQQVDGIHSLEDEYDSASIESMLRDRMNKTISRIKELEAQ